MNFVGIAMRPQGVDVRIGGGDFYSMGFSNQFIPLNISSRMRLDDVVNRISNQPFEATAGAHGRSTKSKHLTTRIATAVSRHFTNDILNKTTIPARNRNWQAINFRTLQEAFCQTATNGPTGLDIEGENHSGVADNLPTWGQSPWV